VWELALKSMLADRGKLLTSLLGVVFSVVLVNLQGGLLLGMIQKASLLVDYGQADIWIGHRYTTSVDTGTFIPERWIQRIRAIEGVERADPYVLMFGQMTMPDGKFENVVVVGCESASLMGNAWMMAEGDPRAIRNPDGILVDVYDAPRLGHCRIRDVREINKSRAQIVGMTKGIVSFTTNPYIFTTMRRARTNFGGTMGIGPDQCSYFLVRAKPGVDTRTLCAQIRARVPELDVYDRKTYSWICMEFWLTRTGIGISFGLAALLGLLVGLAVVAQTLFATVTERIKEFGTLKAMGADDRCISRFLVVQALGSAALGSVLGLFGSVAISQIMSSPRAPVVVTAPVAVLSVVLVVAVCLIAAWLPYLRIRRIDPANTMRGL
jgi:putative ABC transport system permease protein